MKFQIGDRVKWTGYRRTRSRSGGYYDKKTENTGRITSRYIDPNGTEQYSVKRDDTRTNTIITGKGLSKI